MQIRKGVPEDLNRLNELTVQMHEFMGAQMGIKFSREELEHENIDEDELDGVFVAIIDGNIEGYIAFSTKTETNEFYGTYYELHHIVVDEKFRGKGIGKELIRVVVERAKKENVNILTEVLVTNDSVLEFYKKHGFKIVEHKMVLDNQNRMKNI